MLTDRLRAFHDAFNVALAKHGPNAPAITNEILGIAFPQTLEAAETEGADTMLRNGVMSKVKRLLTQGGGQEKQLDMSDIDEGFMPIVKRLHGHSHYVPSRAEYVHVADLIALPEQLNEARQFKRQKGLETIAEADVLDELYYAVVGE